MALDMIADALFAAAAVGDTSRASRATWVKLGMAIVAMACALVVFRIAFAWPDSVFLTPFGSFVTVVAIAISIYYSFLFFLGRRLKRRQSLGA